MRCTANTSRVALLCSKSPPLPCRTGSNRRFLTSLSVQTPKKKKKRTNIAMEVSLQPPYLTLDLHFPSFPGQPWTTSPSLHIPPWLPCHAEEMQMTVLSPMACKEQTSPWSIALFRAGLSPTLHKKWVYPIHLTENSVLGHLGLQGR